MMTYEQDLLHRTAEAELYHLNKHVAKLREELAEKRGEVKEAERARDLLMLTEARMADEARKAKEQEGKTT